MKDFPDSPTTWLRSGVHACRPPGVALRRSRPQFPGAGRKATCQSSGVPRYAAGRSPSGPGHRPRRAVGDQPAGVEHQDAVRDFHYRRHVVLDQHHGDAAGADLTQRRSWRPSPVGIEAGAKARRPAAGRRGWRWPGDLEMAQLADRQAVGRLGGEMGDQKRASCRASSSP